MVGLGLLDEDVGRLGFHRRGVSAPTVEKTALPSMNARTRRDEEARAIGSVHFEKADRPCPLLGEELFQDARRHNPCLIRAPKVRYERNLWDLPEARQATERAALARQVNILLS
jgi:hypothetical protein